ncbi:MAG: oligopeptidase B, partial [Bacteroidetes bacterium]|nr:oligopeptidase B [Bacteroidota bacterium]
MSCRIIRSHMYVFLLLGSTAAIISGCRPDRLTATPPVAKVLPVTLEKHGHVRTDNYFWLRERDNPDVLAYLNAENAYTDSMMHHTQDLQDELYDEIVGRIKQTDSSVPYKQDGFYYYTRYEEGKEYPIYCRKAGSLEGKEEILLNGNERAAGHGFYSAGARMVSSNGQLYAFAEDTVGRRFYTIRVKDLSTGTVLSDDIPATTGNIAWANDNKTLFYSKQDPVSLRPYVIYKHSLGTDPSTDVVVYEEKNIEFSCWIFKTKSKQFLMIVSSQSLSTEYRYLDADKPDDLF